MDETSCYQDAARYYENVPATIDGMLGGFEKISPDDITGSDAFLKWIFKRKEKWVLIKDVIYKKQLF